MQQIEQAMARGIAYLHAMQQTDPGFSGLSSPSIEPFRPQHTYQTTFVPALILGALGATEQAMDIRKPLASWVQAQRSPAGSFNYWAIDAPERHTMPYPDDLDDTFVALAALYRHDRHLVDAGMIGTAVKLLVATEQQVGGPYRTWLVPQDAPQTWQDIDLAVNSNVAYFLGLVAEPLPSLTALMDQAIAGNQFTSPYYPSTFPVLYYMARAYQGEHRRQLATCIAEQHATTPLTVALRLAALARLQSRDLRPATEALIRTQHTDGSWPVGAFCLDAKRSGQRFYHGAAALTTAFAVEALHGYLSVSQPPSRRHAVAGSDQTYDAVIAAAQQSVGGLDIDLRKHARTMIVRRTKGDVGREIALLPYLVAGSLRQSPKPPADATLRQLSLANIFGWIAYTIYDDFLDNEGDPALLSLANVALRKSLQAFRDAIPQTDFQHLVSRTFDTIDNANAWELTHCRFHVTQNSIAITQLPRYGNKRRLAERSAGHILTPLGTLLAGGFTLHTEQTVHVTTALRHYLIARQLLDDLYDWEDDLQSGRATAVVTAALRDIRIRPARYVTAELLRRIRQRFWQRVLPPICSQIQHHLTEGKQALDVSRLFSDGSAVYQLFDRLHVMLTTIQTEQSKAVEFLAAYKKPLA